MPGIALEPDGFVVVGGKRLEYRFAGPQPDQAPLIVLMHEGLGSAGLWGDFLPMLAQSTGAGVFAFSRGGYGASDPVPLPRPMRYMHDEALEILPALLEEIQFREGIFVGHSDGASISAIYAGGVEDERLRGICVIAPHFFIEDISVASVEAAKIAYDENGLRKKLARWHTNVDIAFRGWNDAWRNPEFRAWEISEYLPHIKVPVLAIQGEGDEYGTMRQLEIIREECHCPVQLEMLSGIRHAPHREDPELTCRLITQFFNDQFGVLVSADQRAV